MYQQHFGLESLPFGITPDTSFFFGSSAAQAALNTLLVAARAGEGFIKITGEVGTGKTLLCRQFMQSLEPQFTAAFVPVPSRTPTSLLLNVADELGIDTRAALLAPEAMQQHLLLKALQERLLRLAHAGHRVLVCLDEAQAMSIKTLESLRLLTNLETERRKLMQVVIFGQPELDLKLEHHHIRQLRQRITFEYRLGPLSSAELGEYLRHRLLVAGHANGVLFTPPALRLLRWRTGGLPRLVNIVAHKALMAAYGRGRPMAGLHEIHDALQDTASLRWRLLPALGTA